MRRFLISFVAAFCALLLVSLGAMYVHADDTPDSQEYYSLTKDGVAPAAGLGHGRVIAGFDSVNNLLRWVRTNASGEIITAGGGGAGPQGVAQTPVTRPCDDTGGVFFTANAADLRYTIVNDSTTQDVFILSGATSGADRSTTTGYSFRLGSDAGSGDSSVYVSPSGLRIGGESFACDAAAAANIRIVAWRAQ